MSYFEITEEAKSYLKQKDINIKKLIEKAEPFKREVNPDTFQYLIKSVIAQQISNKALDTVWSRFCTLVPLITADNILALSDEELQSIGISFRKVSYIKGIAKAKKDNTIDFDNLNTLSDSEVCDTLVTLNGIGKWTAEMVLIFSLERPNVFPYDDLVVKNNFLQLMNMEKITKKEWQNYFEKFSPYCTTLSLYLWNMKT